MAYLDAVTEVVITAKDATAAGIDSVKSRFDELKSSAGTLEKVLGAIGVSLSVGAFAGAIKSAIDYADRLNDLSQITGVAVETIGGLGVAAKMSGVDIEAVAKGVGKMQIAMAEAAGGNDKLARGFAAMGVNIKDASGGLRGTEETLYAIADAFAKYKDGPEKAALATEYFGRAGRELIPFLNMGGDALRELREEYARYGGVTGDTAKRADEFNDTIERIKMTSGALWRTIASDLLPVMQTLADLFLESKQKGDDFNQTASGITVIFKAAAVSAMFLAETFRSIGTSIGAAAAVISTALSGNWSSEEWKRAVEINRQANADISANWEKTSANIDRVWSASMDSVAIKAKKAGGDSSGPIVAAGAEIGKAFEKVMESAAKMAAVTSANWAKVFGSGEVTQAGRALAEIMASADWKKFDDGRQQAIRSAYQLVDAEQKLQAQFEKSAKAAADYAETQRKEREAYMQAKEDAARKAQAEVNAYTASNERLAREIELVGQGELAHRLFAAALEYEAEKRKLGVNATDETLRQLDEEYEKRKRLIAEGFNREQIVEAAKKASEETGRTMTQMVSDLTSATSTFIVDLVNNGSAAFKNLWDRFKAWALQALAEIAAKQIVVSVLGAVGVTGAGGAAASAGGTASGMGGLGNLGTLGSIASGLSGIGTMASLGYSAAAAGYGAAGGQTVGMMMAAGAGDATAVGAGGIAAGIEGGLTVGLGAIPVAGWVALAGLIVAGIIAGQKHGGPKSGGYYATGETPGISGTDSGGRWMTPSDMDATIQSYLGPVQKKVTDFLTAVGATADVVFAQGYSTDPKGTAPSNVHTGAWVNGQQVGDFQNANVGRDDAALQAEIQKQAMQAVLAALQATELPAVVKEVLATVDVNTATTQEITQVLQDAQSVYGIVEGLKKIGVEGLNLDAIKNMAQAGETLSETYARVGAAVTYYTDHFVSASDRYAKAQTSVADVFTGLGMTVPKTRDEFSALVQGLDLSTEAGAKTYNALMTVAPAWVSLQENLGLSTRTIDGVTATVDQHIAILQAEGRGYAATQLEREKALAGMTAEEAAAAKLVFAAQDAAKTRELEVALMEAQGRSYEALQARREQELASLSASDQAIQRQIYAAQDKAKTDDLLIKEQDLLGNSAEVLSMRRQKELAALSEGDKAIQERIYKLEDEAAAYAEANRQRNMQTSFFSSVAQFRGADQSTLDQIGLTGATNNWIAALDRAHLPLLTLTDLVTMSADAFAGLPDYVQQAGLSLIGWATKVNQNPAPSSVAGSWQAWNGTAWVDSAAMAGESGGNSGGSGNDALQRRAQLLAQAEAAERALLPIEQQHALILEDLKDAESQAAQERIWAAQAAKVEQDAAAQAAQSLQQQLDNLTKQETDLKRSMLPLAEARAQELAELDPSLRAIQERIYALQDEYAVMQEHKTLQDQLKAATTALLPLEEQRSLALAALKDDESRSLQTQIWAAQDKAKTDALLIREQQALGNSSVALSMQREKELAAMSASEQAIQKRIYAIEDEASALAKANAQRQSSATYDQAIAKFKGASGVQLAQMDQSAALAGMAANVPGMSTIEQAFNLGAAAFANLTQAQQGYVLSVINTTTALNAATDAEKATASATRDALNIGLMEAEGRAFDALIAKRDLELSKLSDADKATQKLIYAAQDKAKTDSLLAREQELLGNATDATTLKRNAELAALSASDQVIQKRIYALEDEAAALAALNAQRDSGSSYLQAIAKYNGASEVELAQLAASNALQAMQDNVPGVQSLTAALNLAPSAFSALTKSQQDYVLAAINTAAALNAATDAAKNDNAVLQQRKSLADQVRSLELQLMTKEQQRAAILADIHDDESRRLQQQIFDLEDLAAARSEEARAAQEAAAAEKQRVDELKRGLTETAQRFAGFASSLRQFRDQLLRQDSSLSPEARYQAAKAQYERTAASALAGNEAAINSLQNSSSAYLDAARAYYGSTGAYADAYNQVLGVLDAVIADSELAASDAEKQLAALNGQTEELTTLNANVVDVKAVIQELIAAQNGNAEDSKAILSDSADLLKELGISLSVLVKVTQQQTDAITAAVQDSAKKVSNAVS